MVAPFEFYTVIVVATYSHEPYLLLYDKSMGTMAIARVRADGKSIVEVTRGRWRTALTVIVPVVGGAPLVLSYSGSNGEVAIDAIVRRL
jgi:hypothetical protein